MSTLTVESIMAAREFFAANALACIAEMERGEVTVSNPAGYRSWCMRRHADALAGKHDHTFAFRQRAYYIQTGECVPLLA